MRFFSLVLLVGLLLGGLLVPRSVLAASYPCTEAGLESAIATGGDSSFNCSGAETIVLTKDWDPSRAITKNVTLRAGTGSLTIDANNLYRHFVINPNVTLTLIDLTITRGRVTDASAGGPRGGSIFINQGARLDLTNVFVTDNNAVSFNPTQQINGAFGGAIYNYQGTLVVSQSTFQRNQANGVTNATGGAIYLAESPLTDIRKSLMTENSAQSTGLGTAEGGVISNYKGKLTLVDDVFQNNFALTTAGFGYSRGGAISNENVSGSTSTIIYNTFIQNNTAESRGASGTAHGGGIYNAPGSDLTLTLVSLDLNLSKVVAASGFAFGGGIMSNGTVLLQNSTVLNNAYEASANHGSGSGLAVSAQSGTISYKSSVFVRFPSSSPLCTLGVANRLVSLGSNSFTGNDSCSTIDTDTTPQSIQVATVPANSTTTLTTKPVALGNQGITADVTNTGSLPLSLSLANLPASALIGQDGASLIGMDGATLIGQDGATLVKLNLIGQDGATLIGQDGSSFAPPGPAGLRSIQSARTKAAADGNKIVIAYYYPSTVTGTAEENLNLYYNTGQGWSAIYGSGPSVPTKDTTDNLDGTVSGGRFTVTFDSSSRPPLSKVSSLNIAAIQGTIPPPGFRVLIPLAQVFAP